MKKYLFLSSALFVLWSCEKTIDFEIPKDPPRITIDAKLQTDTWPRAIVGTSEYSLSPGSPSVDSLTNVSLYEDGRFVERLSPKRYDSDIYDNFGNPTPAYYYEGGYRPAAGHTYEIRATRNGYEDAVGRAFMYESVNLTGSNYNSETGDLEVSFSDPPGRGDYYRISIFPRGNSGNEYYDSYFGSYDPTIEFFEFDEFDDFLVDDGLSFGYAGYLSDEFFDGSVKKLKLVYLIGRFGEPGSTNKDPFDVIIGRVSESYYLHERSKAAQTVENPFSEPTPIYGNVENGYGIVATSSNSRVYIQP